MLVHQKVENPVFLDYERLLRHLIPKNGKTIER